MIEQETTQEDLDNLYNDAEYLLDEAEALKYVIDRVPYDESPPNGMSIYNMLRLIDHAQTNYFRPVIENVFAENRLQRLSEFEHYTESFDEDPDEETDIQKVLSRIIKHRAALINSIKQIPLIDWEKKLKQEQGNEINLLAFAERMITTERKKLKEIADLVLVYQNEKTHQREIENKASQRKNSGQQ